MEITKLQPTASLSELIALGDWSLICATCHFDGSHAKLLTGADLQTARSQADGFGDLRGLWSRFRFDRQAIADDEASMICQVIIEGDWSHFRDSNPEGQERVARFIRTVLIAKLTK